MADTQTQQPPTPTVPMFAPDGTLGDVPYEHMHDALSAGAKMGVKVVAPDGTLGVVPADRLQDALKAGGKTVPYDLSDADGPKKGFWGTLGDKASGLGHDISDFVSKGFETPTTAAGVENQLAAPATIVGNLASAVKHQATRPIPTVVNSPTYRAAVTLSPLVPGLNPEAMEKASAKGDTGAVAAEAAVPTAMAVAPLAAEGTAAGVKAALPSAERAGKALGQVKTLAGSVPIDMSGPGKTALELYTQSQRGATLPKVVRDFVNRATKPGSEPITYAEAKDFQSNVSSLSAEERMQTKPNTLRLIGQLNSDLKSSLEDAADTVGKGQQFADAMQEYHHAMKLRGLSEDAISAIKTHFIKALVTGAGITGGGFLLKKALDK